jgi:hypothetical protein
MPSGLAQDMHRALAALPTIGPNPTPADLRNLISSLKEHSLLAPDWQPAPRHPRP